MTIKYSYLPQKKKEKGKVSPGIGFPVLYCSEAKNSLMTGTKSLTNDFK